MMSEFVAYALLTLLALTWIASDAETIHIFDVFGKNFRFVWFDSGQRWKLVSAYGWRLVALCSFVVLNVLLSYRVYSVNPFDLRPLLQRTVSAALVAASFTPIPCIYFAHQFRWLHQVRCAALRLSDLVESVTADADLGQILVRADYETKEPWTAWHPTLERWRADELWRGLVPVLYLRKDSRSILVPIEPEAFLAWNIASDCVRINTDLPVRGAFNSSYCVKSVEAIRGRPNWWLVRTEMRTELDAVFEGRG
jgi:hypothetical protein